MPELIPTEHDLDRGDAESDPELVEVQQRDQYPAAVLVEPNGPVDTHELPARSSVFRSVAVTGPDQVMGVDLRRKRATLISLDQPIWIGRDRNDVAGTVATAAGIPGAPGAVWPANVPYEHRGSAALWIASATNPVAPTATRVAVILDSWAD